MCSTGDGRAARARPIIAREVFAVQKTEACAGSVTPIRRMILWQELIHSESGQDLLEYTILLGALGLAGAAFLVGVGNLTKGLFTIANSRLMSASQ